MIEATTMRSEDY